MTYSIPFSAVDHTRFIDLLNLYMRAVASEDFVEMSRLEFELMDERRAIIQAAIIETEIRCGKGQINNS